MINIPVPKLASFKSRPSPLLNLLQNTQHTTQDFKNNLSPLKVDPKSCYSKVINVGKQQFSKYKSTLEWRAKTQFPIIKVKNWKLLQQKMPDQEAEVEILIELQGPFKSLQDFDTISFAHSIYVLKESLIGFQRLCYHFGNFYVDSSMIKFNEAGICKVWINKDCFQTKFNLRAIQSEKDFIMQLCSVIKSKITKSSSAKIFFQTIQNCHYFFQAIGAIDLFTKQHLINVPSSVQNLQDCKSPLLKKSLNSFSDQNKQNLTVSGQIPTFLKKNELKKKKFHQASSPSSKNNLTVKKKSFFYRSFTDIQPKFSSFMGSKKHSGYQQSFKDDNNQTKKGQGSGINQFFLNLDIRLIQPNQEDQQSKVLSNDSLPFINHKAQINPENKKNVLRQISDIGSSQEHQSGLSFRQYKSHKQEHFDHNNPNISVKITQPQRLNGSFLPNNFYFPIKNRHPKEINQQTQQKLNFQQIQIDLDKLSPQMKHSKENRKYSGDIESNSDQTEKKTPQNIQIKVPSFLNSLKNHKNQASLAKSPSHQIIGSSEMQIGIKNLNKDKILFRQTLIIGTDFGIDKKKKDEQNLFLRVEDKKENPREQAKTKVKKLAFLGRKINESSDTEQAQFELEYGTKIKKEKSIRKQILNILD